MASVMALEEAIAEYVVDGSSVALEGFTHLIPHAAAHQIVRQGSRNLTLIRMTPDILSDQLIGMGCISKLVFSWGGNPGAGSLYRFRDAVEQSWPEPMAIEEHSHAAMANRYVAGASGLPFAVLRAYDGNGLETRSDTISHVTCPFTGQKLTAVAALNPDVGIIHAQQADKEGNIHLWGITGIQKEVILASKRTLVTVEEIVDRFDPLPHSSVLPAWVVDAVVVVPGGAHPSYALGYYDRDNDFYLAWSDISKDRDRFLHWMKENVVSNNPTGRA
jgi:glutaconate CoA-transferase subunit A